MIAVFALMDEFGLFTEQLKQFCAIVQYNGLKSWQLITQWLHLCSFIDHKQSDGF